MAYWTFTRDIIEGRPISVFNNGELERDFTSIDDIVAGVVATALQSARDRPAAAPHLQHRQQPPRAALAASSRSSRTPSASKAERIMVPMQAGDVRATCANIDAIRATTAIAPTTKLEEGIPRFVNWYRAWTKT